MTLFLFLWYIKKDKNIIDFNDIEHYALKILVKKDEKGDLAKEVFEGNILDGLRKGAYDNFTIEIFGQSIREQKQTAYEIGHLCGENITFEYNGKKYRIIKDVRFAEGTKAIGANAFYKCTSLENVTLPENTRSSLVTCSIFNPSNDEFSVFTI